ncbi:Pituitary tumor-transforming gene protein-binding factor [Balamuthia mandrillaris]
MVRCYPQSRTLRVVCIISLVLLLGLVGLCEGDAPSSCSGLKSCSECTSKSDCVWCESDETCTAGTFYGPKGNFIDGIFKGCSDWRWKQCKANGKMIVLGTAGGLGGLILLAALCCCCCCYFRCCRRRRGQRKDKREAGGYRWSSLPQNDLQMDELPSYSRTAHPHTDSKRAEYYAKYGTPEQRAALREERKNRAANLFARAPTSSSGATVTLAGGADSTLLDDSTMIMDSF